MQITFTVEGLSDTIQQSKPTTKFEYGDEPNRHIFNVRHANKQLHASLCKPQSRSGSCRNASGKLDATTSQRVIDVRTI